MDAKIATVALNRFGLGARFDLRLSDRNKIAADPRGYLLATLKREPAQVAEPTLLTSKAAVVAILEYQQKKKAMRKAAPPAVANAAPMNSQSAMPMAEEVQPSGMKKPQALQQKILQQEAMARFGKAFSAEVGFVERLVWFWSNHFAISIAKGAELVALAGAFEGEAIRPHVLGKFGDMLRAVEQHPAMLAYLDNRNSIGPNSRAGQRQQKGLNENLAREILELHTIGVNGGYTQSDVTAFAKIITGWTVPGLNAPQFERGVFVFTPNRHEPGSQKVLGKTYAQTDQTQGEAVLDDLVRHSATAKHIALKFARHFVADHPPQQLVEKLASSFLITGGDLLALTTTLLQDDAAWNPQLQKLRSPQEFFIATARALNLPAEKPQQVLGVLNQLGQPLWRPPGPNGFSDDSSAWASSEGIATRLALSDSLSRRSKISGSPSELLQVLLGDFASADTSQTVMRAESKAQGIALLLMSPEFQRR